MPIADPTRVYDGFSNLAGGVDDGRLPNLIDKNQCVEAENAVFRGGAPTNRPPIRNVELTWDNPNLTYNEDGTFQSEDGVTAQSRTRFLLDIFQEASYFAPMVGAEYIMASVGGRLYRITPTVGQTATVREVILSRRNRKTIPMAYHLQAGTYHITQDANALPIIYDGVTARRSAKNEIFTGKMMGYGQGRIVLIGKDDLIYFGDIRDGKGNGDADLLGFTETFFLNEGFPSALPSGMGVPQAIQFIAQQDSATGVGECLVFGTNGVESFYLSLPRETWKDSAFQHTALLGIGTAGHRTVAAVNEDVWFRCPRDGWRSYRQARAQINQWAQIPMSTNVRKWVSSETPWLLKNTSAISFNNRLIVTTSPYPGNGHPFANGLLSLDFDILSTFGTLSNPAWDGHWGNRVSDPEQGLRITRLVEGMFNGQHRAFAFAIDIPTGHNKLFEIMPEEIGDDTLGRITSSVTSRALDFDAPFNEKEIYGGDIWIDNISAPTTFPLLVSLSYRPDQIPFWTDWANFSLAAVGTPGEITPGGVPTISAGFSPRRKLPKPSNEGDPDFTKRILRRAYDAQVKIQWAGRARIRKFRLHGKQLVEDSKGGTPT